MKKIAKRKSRLSFITNQVARYRGREREIVPKFFRSMPPFAYSAPGPGTVSWRGVFDLAAEIFARREKDARKLARKLKLR